MNHTFIMHTGAGAFWRDEYKCTACGIEKWYSIEAMMDTKDVNLLNGECSEEDQIVFRLKGAA